MGKVGLRSRRATSARKTLPSPVRKRNRNGWRDIRRLAEPEVSCLEAIDELGRASYGVPSSRNIAQGPLTGSQDGIHLACGPYLNRAESPLAPSG